MNDLYKAFQQYFEVVIADTPELLKIVFHIRFQVLCVEKRIPGFDKLLYPDGLESDNYDSRSIHVLLRFRPSGDFIGTVRLIQFDSLHPEKPFPIELHTQFDPALCDMSQLLRQHTAEISRFVVLSKFDRRKAERRNLETRKNSIDITTANKDRRSLPYLTIALVAGVVAMSLKYDIRNWLSMMDPALNRLLSCIGVGFIPIGPSINYHGSRQPYFVKLADVLIQMQRENHDVLEVMMMVSGKYNHSVHGHQ